MIMSSKTQLRLWVSKDSEQNAINYRPQYLLIFISETSLDTLVEDLKKRNPDHPFKILKHSMLCKTDGKFDIEKFDMLKKGKSKIPYEKLDYKYLFTIRKEPPPKMDYYSLLKDTHIDDSTYNDIRRFWSLYSCQSIAEYSSYYVSLDTVLLAEVRMLILSTHAFHKYSNELIGVVWIQRLNHVLELSRPR